MDIDLRRDLNNAKPLRFMDATTINLLIEYIKRNSINTKDIDSIIFEDSKHTLMSKIGWACAIAKLIDGKVLFFHAKIIITAYPNTAAAALACFESNKKFNVRGL